MNRNSFRVFRLVASSIALIAGSSSYAHEVDPLLLVYSQPTEFHTITVKDAGTCQANIQLTSNNPTIVTVSPAAGSGISASFTATAVARGSTTIAVTWQGFGTDNMGIPCTENGGTFVEVRVLPEVKSTANTNDAATVSDPVNSYSGEFILEEKPDVDLGGPIPVQFARYYGSALYREEFGDSSLGAGWLHTYDFQMLRRFDFFDPERFVLIVTNQGRFLRFSKETGSWVLQDNTDQPWQLIDDGFDLLLADPLRRRIYRFDDFGRLTQIQDLNGNTLTVNWTSVFDGSEFVDRIATVADGLGRILTFGYDGNAKLATVDDGIPAEGVRTRLYTVTNNALVSYVDAENNATAYAYDTSKPAYGPLLTAKTMPLTNTPFTQVYDGNGLVSTQTDGEGNTWSFAYGPSTTTITDPLGHASTHGYDPVGQLTDTTDDGPGPIAKEYDVAGRVSGIVTDDPQGAEISYQFEYDPASGNVSRIIYPDGIDVTLDYVSRQLNGLDFYFLNQVNYPDANPDSYQYDAFGNQTGRTDRQGGNWTYTYTGQGQMATAQLPTLGTYTLSYNPDGTVSTMTDPSSNTTTYSYDGFRRLDNIGLPDGNTLSFAYDNNDNLVSLIDQAGIATMYAYDDNGNIESTEDGRNNVATFSYDSLDRLIAVTDPDGGISSRTFDALGRLANVTDRNGNTISVTFDPVTGLDTGRVDAAGNIWSRAYDVNGYITSQTDPEGGQTQYQTSVLGQITQSTSPEGGIWQLEHDVMTRLSGVVDPNGNTAQFAYNGNSLLTDVEAGESGQPALVGTSYVRNTLGMVESIVDSLGSAWQSSYDNQARLSSATDPLGTSTLYGHNNRDQVSTVTYPDSMGTQTITYTPTGLVSRRLFSDGTDLNYNYDSVGSLISADGITLTPNPQGEVIESNGLILGRDPGGRVTSLEYAAGKVVTYVYDERDLPVEVSDWLGGTTTMAYDKMGRMSSITRPNGVTTSFVHNMDGAVVDITEESGAPQILSDISLTRDHRGLINQASREVPLPPGLTSRLTRTAYDVASRIEGNTYDAVGQLVSDGSRTYSWDLAGRLTGYTQGSVDVTYAYDAVGKRISRSEGSTTKSYVWNYGFPAPVMATVKIDGSDDAYYVYTPYGQLLYRISAAGQRHFYHFDEVGNTLFLTDDGGDISDRYATTPFGVLLDHIGNTDNPFIHMGQTGAMRDDNVDLYYMRARHYDADHGRFVSRDQFNRSVSPLETNPYAYARQNPLLYNDPMGYNAQVRYDGDIHTDIVVDIWCGDQIIGTLKLGFFQTNYRNMGTLDAIGTLGYGAPSTIKGVFHLGGSLGPPGRSGNNITTRGNRAQDERLARHLLKTIGVELTSSVTPGDYLKNTYKPPKGRTSQPFPINVNSTKTYGAYRAIICSRVCNDYTDNALDVYYGHDWMNWASPVGHFGSELFNSVVRYERINQAPLSDGGNWLSNP